MIARLALVIVVATGCGRVGFGGIGGMPDDDARAEDALEGDAPTADALTVDARGDAPGIDATAFCGGRPGVVFCDGFETATLDAWSHVGTAAQNQVVVHSGLGALRVESPSTQPSAVEASAFANLTSGSVYARAWFFVPSGAGLTKINLLAIDGSGTTQGVVLLADQDKLVAYGANGGGTTVTTDKVVPRDVWFCLELHVGISSTSGSITVSLGGVPIGTRTGVNTLPSSGYEVLGIGLLYIVPPQAPTTMYMDDVIGGTQPIGCS